MVFSFIRTAFLIVLSIAFLVSCESEKEDNLTGTVIKSKEVLVSQILTDQIKPLDTIAIEEGMFSYNNAFTKPEILLLEFSEGMRMPLVIKPGDKITIDVNDTLPYGTFTAQGSNSVKLLEGQNKLFAQTMSFIDSLDRLSQVYMDSANYTDERLKWNAAFESRISKHREQLLALIASDSTDLANIMAFYQSRGSLEIIGFPEDERYFEMVDNGLQATYPENEHAIFFHESLIQAKEALARENQLKAAQENIKEGALAPDIIMEDFNGLQRKLSDLRGNVVLIDFWASWCAPCRRANPDLVKLYNKYNAKGFEIFSVSLDGLDQQPNPMQEWQAAIANDGLIWENHVSELKGYGSKVILQYGFSGIPFTVLLDREGRIVAKNLRGEQLESKLKSMF